MARWLDTVLCNNRTKQYAEVFKQLGCESLNDVFRLDPSLLLKMGVTQLDCEKIMENVSVLRQTQSLMQCK